jgi:lipopolysaccharide export system ATP-binding protein
MRVNPIVDFALRLRPHEASIGLVLAELVRRGGEDGAVERGEWLAAIRRAGAEVEGRPGTSGDDHSTDDLARYLDEHVIAQLVAAGVVMLEPEAGHWEVIRVAPSLWSDVREDREAVQSALDSALRNLLTLTDRRATNARSDNEFDADQREPGSTLRARGLVKAYRKRKVVNEVELEVSQGEIVGLLGPNGAGKTTTFYMIVGLIAPDRGRVFLDEKELTKTPMFRRARAGLGYLAQEPSVFRKLSVEENILAILETMGMKRAERKQRLEALLDELGLKHLRRAKAYSLSGGERRRLEITRALVSRPKFMLLDEPFAGVDPIAVHDIQQIVASLRHRGIGVIISDHNVEQTLDIVDRAYIMYDGRVRVSGTVAELVWNDEVAEIYFGPTLTARMRQRYRRPEAVV